MSFTDPEDIFKAVKKHIDELRLKKEGLPERTGKLNVTAFATACGVDRGRLYTNPKVKGLVDEAVKELGLKGIEPRELRADNEKANLERRITLLEERLSNLSAENCELRERLTQYRHIDEIVAQGKRIF